MNGSVDHGLFQINSTHNAEALKRGDNLTTVEGNLDYGFYLASEQGFSPWKATADCAGATIMQYGSRV